MDKVYDQTKAEAKWYKFWEENGFFSPEINPEGEPYTIILPPPNANANLHFGHAMFTLEDILIRYQRMRGKAALWLPGSDHAGFETQVVFEKHLAAEGKSRFDYDRTTLYKMIWEFVHENKGNMESQLRRLGFSVDWTREKFTLDEDIVKVVYKTFKKLFDDNLAYRANRLVNYCTKDGTSFSDLEVVSEEKEGQLYHIKFPLKKGGFITIATTRPETIVGDVAVMVNPDDTRYRDLIGETVILPIVNREVPLIADEYVDMEFGTGAVKVTPAHDFNDFEIAKKHNLTHPPIIGFNGKMQNVPEFLEGLYVKQAREVILQKLEELSLLEEIKPHKMVIKKCYKCGMIIEPLPLEQWYIKIEPLAKKALDAVKSGKIKIYPQNFESIYFNWMENIKDWNISRQIVWGIQIPAWRCKGCNKWTVTEGETPDKCSNCSSFSIDRDQDTFDTWFSSGQWPYATLQTTKEGDFEKFYPTSVMETGRDILFFWVARMIMLGIYATDKVPFKHILLHGMVLDPLGKKMSKSKGNVVNPMEIADQYGADAARMALIFGVATGHDQALSYQKLEAMRKFTNKLWNIGRFIEFQIETNKFQPSYITLEELNKNDLHKEERDMLSETQEVVKDITNYLESYQFNLAAERLYEYMWHSIADNDIERIKRSIQTNNGKTEETELMFNILVNVFRTCLELLHPFMPFLTEELWQRLPHKEKSIMISQWPVEKKYLT